MMIAIYHFLSRPLNAFEYWRGRSSQPYSHNKPIHRSLPLFSDTGLEPRISLTASGSTSADFLRLNPAEITNHQAIHKANTTVQITYNEALKIPDCIGTQYANRLTLEDISRIARFGFKSIRISIDPLAADLNRYSSLIHAMWAERITPILVMVSPADMNSADTRERLIKAAASIAAQFADGPILWDD